MENTREQPGRSGAVFNREWFVWPGARTDLCLPGKLTVDGALQVKPVKVSNVLSGTTVFPSKCGRSEQCPMVLKLNSQSRSTGSMPKTGRPILLKAIFINTR